MAVGVMRGARGRWVEAPLDMRLRTDASDEVVADVVAELNRRLPALDVPDADFAHVDAPLPLPDGFGLVVHLWDAPPEVCATLVDEVVAVLDEHGVDGRLGAMDGAMPPEPPGPSLAAVAVVAHHADGLGLARLDADAVADALGWAIDGADGDVSLRVRRAHLVVPAGAARQLADQAVERRDPLLVDARHGDDSRLVRIHAGDGARNATHVAVTLQGGTPAIDLLGAFEVMVQRARLLGEGADWTYVECRPGPQAGVGAGNPFWAYRPDPGEASPLLVDRVLEAHPWQRLTPAQAAHLPEELDDEASFDAVSGELRLGAVAGWLRDRPWRAHDRMAGRMRRALGPLLASRGEAWERAQEGEPPPVDVATTPLVQDRRRHPSLGVRPEELVGLRRGLPLGMDPEPEVSITILRWLKHLEVYGDPETLEWLREPLLRLADSPATAPRWDDRHRRTMVGWVLGTLAPGVVEVAGLPGAGTLRRVGVLEPGTPALAVVDVALGVLAASGGIVEEQWQLGYTGDDRAQQVGMMVRSFGSAAGQAACAQRPPMHLWGPAHSTACNELARARMDGPIGADTARRVYMAGARVQATGVFCDTVQVASRLVPSRAHEWESAVQVVSSHAEVGAATALAGDPATAWDRGIEVIRARAEGSWDDAEAALVEAFGADVVAEAWNVARAHLAHEIRTTRAALIYAALVAPAEALVDLGSALAQRDGRTDALEDVLRESVDALVDALTETPRPARADPR